MKRKVKFLTTALSCMTAAAIFMSGCGSSSAASSASSGAGSATTSQSSAADQSAKTDYPKKNIQLVVPLSAGGDTDLNARLLATYLSKKLGVSVVVLNVAGGSGTIGMDQVKNSNPDGYTVLFYHTEAMIPEIAGMVNDKLADSFKLVGTCLTDNTTILVTYKGAPYQNLSQLKQYAKANPGKVQFGMMTGGYPHLIGLALQQKMGVKLNLVDVGGNSPKLAAILGKKTDVINIQYSLVKDYLQRGDLVCLGLCSPERNDLLPDVKTTKEEGVDMDFNKFFFCAMPKNTPDDVVNRFSEAMNSVVEDPEFIASAKKSYLNPTYMNPADTVTYANKVYNNLVQYQDLFRAASKK